MRALSTSELLRVWEEGTGQSPVRRALLLLTSACPEAARDELARLSLGRRDRRLLLLREWTFGPQLVSVANCAKCGERLELTLNTADLRANGDETPAEAWSLSAEGYELRWRLPNSEDLLALSNDRDVTVGRGKLLTRCVMEIHHNGDVPAPDQLPESVVQILLERMAQADPQADIQLNLTCPACGHQWLTAFDIVSFFWSELEGWAPRLLREVHLLASAYGWREADILALGARRRQIYLELIGEP